MIKRQIPNESVFNFPKRDYQKDDFGSGYVDQALGQLLQVIVQTTKEDATILEIGAGLSTSYIHSKQGKRIFHSCDPKWAFTDPKTIPKEITYHPEKSEELLATWKDPIDFLWIDGDHSFRGCMTDLMFTDYLVKGGFLLVHDYYNAGVPGVMIACKEMITEEKYNIYLAVEGIWIQPILLTNFEGRLTYENDPINCLFATKK